MIRTTWALAVLAMCACGPNNPPLMSAEQSQPPPEQKHIDAAPFFGVNATVDSPHPVEPATGWIRELTLGALDDRIHSFALNRNGTALVFQGLVEPHPQHIQVLRWQLRQFGPDGEVGPVLPSTNWAPDRFAHDEFVIPAGDGFAFVGAYWMHMDGYARAKFDCAGTETASFVVGADNQCRRPLNPEVAGRVYSVVVNDPGRTWLVKTVQGMAGAAGPLEIFNDQAERIAVVGAGGSTNSALHYPLMSRGDRLVAAGNGRVSLLDENAAPIWEAMVDGSNIDAVILPTGEVGAVMTALNETDVQFADSIIPADAKVVALVFDASGQPLRAFAVPNAPADFNALSLDDRGFVYRTNLGIVAYDWFGVRAKDRIIATSEAIYVGGRVVAANEAGIRLIVAVAPNKEATLLGTVLPPSTKTRRFLIGLSR